MIGASKKLLQATAGNAGGGPLDITDVFSTYLYTGNGSTQTITNGIDLSGEGGLVWIKSRTTSDYGGHYLRTFSPSSGKLDSSWDGPQNNFHGSMSTLSNGFQVGGGPNTVTQSGIPHASWTFRKAPKFFDVVTWTGNGVNGRNVAHSLGSAIGSVFLKRTDASKNWFVWHRSAGITTNAQALYLNANSAMQNTGNNAWGPINGSPSMTTTTFSVGDDLNVNGGTYVAYLFAHNDGDGEFGPDGDQDIIKCGSAPASAATDINLGFEPQWIMIKRTEASGDWQMFDTMRGLFAVSSPDDRRLKANTSDAEAGSGSSDYLYPTPTGFHINTNFFGGGPYIYMAIRRGPLAPPESATEVFAIDASPNSSFPVYEAGFPVDLGIRRYNYPSSGNSYFVGDRLRGGQRLITNLTNAEANTTDVAFDSQDGWWTQPENSTSISWMWKRAPGFFEVVAYTGDNNLWTYIPHNLGVAPDMVVCKSRSGTGNWQGLFRKSNGQDVDIILNSSNAARYDPAHAMNSFFTSTTIQPGFISANASGVDYMAYLFASLPGISKVGSYTGNDTSQTIDCGFTSGARFVLIKCLNDTGDWFFWDTTRGIVSGNDSYLILNNTEGQNTSSDDIDPQSTGFAVNQANAAINESGKSYIFYAIA